MNPVSLFSFSQNFLKEDHQWGKSPRLRKKHSLQSKSMIGLLPLL